MNSVDHGYMVTYCKLYVNEPILINFIQIEVNLLWFGLKLTLDFVFALLIVSVIEASSAKHLKKNCSEWFCFQFMSQFCNIFDQFELTFQTIFNDFCRKMSTMELVNM